LPLPDGEFIVGRALGCHVRFNAAEVSRQHMRLTVKGGRCVAENLSGTTGTMLNGRKMAASSSLRHGDELTLGPRKLRIEVEDAVAAGIGPQELQDDSGEILGEATRPGSISAGIDDPHAPAIEFHTCPKCPKGADVGGSVCEGW